MKAIIFETCSVANGSCEILLAAGEALLEPGAEIVYAWPGITPILLNSIARQDIYVVLGFLVVSTLLLIVGNLISDLLLAAVDPRIRYA